MPPRPSADECPCRGESAQVRCILGCASKRQAPPQRRSTNRGTAVGRRCLDVPTSSSYICFVETIGLRELNQNPSRAVARVRAGESLVVTDRGKPILRMVPEVESPGVLSRLVHEPSALARERNCQLAARGRRIRSEPWQGQRPSPSCLRLIKRIMSAFERSRASSGVGAEFRFCPSQHLACGRWRRLRPRVHTS